jgi:alpha-glucosidase
LTPERVAEVQTAFSAAAPDGWACWAFSNHDVIRHVSRWGQEVLDRDAFAKMLSGILLSQRGSVCIYQGEELGLTEADIAYADLQDPYGIQFWPEFKGRDGCRTPMVWDAQALKAGFSTAEKTWLPIPVEHQLHAVSAQYGDPASVLEQYRRFLAFRKQHTALSKGDMLFLPQDGTVLAYKRQFGNETVLCLFNMSATEAVTELPIGNWDVLEGHGFESSLDGTRLELPAWGGFFARYA